MKVVVYQKEKKFTVHNVSIADIQKFQEMLEDGKINDLTLKDLQLYNFRITSTRGVVDEWESIQDEALEKEVEEGIVWHNETVN